MRIAIVGAEESKWTEQEKKEVVHYIYTILRSEEGASLVRGEPKPILVSGGCRKGGVDIWAEDAADALLLEKKIFKPEVEQWEDRQIELRALKGYKSRNIQIAEVCDILYCFSPGTDKLPEKMEVLQYHRHLLYREDWNGGIWTADYAVRLGKKVIRIVVKA